MKTTSKVASVLGVVLAMSLLVVALIPASPVSAATSENRPNIAEKRAEYRERRERNVAMADANRDLRDELKALLPEAKADMDQQTLADLKAMRTRLRKLVEDLQSIRGDIREVVKNNPALIPGIQQARYQKLTAINGLLQEMVELVS